MKTPSKPPKENPAPERNAPLPGGLDQNASAPSGRLRHSGSKCPGLEDLLGNYSEQTGSFFG